MHTEIKKYEVGELGRLNHKYIHGSAGVCFASSFTTCQSPILHVIPVAIILTYKQVACSFAIESVTSFRIEFHVLVILNFFRW